MIKKIVNIFFYPNFLIIVSRSTHVKPLDSAEDANKYANDKIWHDINCYQRKEILLVSHYEAKFEFEFDSSLEEVNRSTDFDRDIDLSISVGNAF